jgi:diguanylate cyclase (GGDEF)-like protein
MGFRGLDLSPWLSVLRSRMGLQDAVIVLAVVLTATLFAFEYDFFEHADTLTTHQKRITVGEFFALTGLLILGLISFSIRRLQEQKREFQRRLTAEIAAFQARGEALRDLLTGLPNRRALYEALDATIGGATERGESHALVMLDLNGFKSINDKYGHPVGDKLLEHIGRRLQSPARKALAARLGGDEFAVFLPDVQRCEEAPQFARGLIAAIEQPIVIDGVSHKIGAAAGIAYFPQHGRSHADLLRHADLALYRAKAEKTSAVHCYSDEDRAA